MTSAELASLNDLKLQRNQLIKVEEWIKNRELRTKPPIVQELVLARRHVEDARMRLRIAIAMIEESEN